MGNNNKPYLKYIKPVKSKEDYIKRRNRYKLISNGTRLSAMIFIGLYLLISVAGLLYGVNKFKGYLSDVPEVDDNVFDKVKTTLIVDSSGKTLMELGMNRVDELPMDEMSNRVKESLISVEDKRFYSHHGFDLIRLGKAVETSLRGNFGAEGGSTITQQLAKLSYLDQYEDTLERKSQELYLAWKLEEKYTKDEILKNYINKVYMGNGVYGMRTASLYYYGKELNELKPYELAIIVGTPNSPENYNPYGNEESVKYRRDTVLTIFKNNGLIDSKKYEEYLELPVNTGVIPPEENIKREFENLNKAPNYLATPLNSVIREAKELLPDLYTGGYVIKTSISESNQKYAHELVTTNKRVSYPDKDMLVSFIVLNNKTGKVEMMDGGSRNKTMDVNGYNYVTDLQRQSGSSIKPILDFAPYFEIKKGNPTDLVEDSPISYSDGTPINNYYRDYKGNITVQRALEESRNTTAYRLMLRTGIKESYDFANKLGMGFKDDERRESGALGSISNANPYKMARAFSVFASDGVYRTFPLIDEIEDSNGVVVHTTNRKGKTVMSKKGARNMTTILRGVITSDYGTAPELKLKNRYVAGKTGTTNYSDEEATMYNVSDRGAPDIWFVGYDSKYTVAVWVGYDTRKDHIKLKDQDKAKEVARDIWLNFVKENNTFKNK